MCLRSADDPSGTYPCFEITYNEDTSVASGKYFIRNKFSGQYLDVYNSGISSGTNVIQFPFNGEANQIWQITCQNGLYIISPAHTPNMYLQSEGGQNTDGNNVVQGVYNTSYPYHLWWRLVQNGNGTYRIMPYISTILALDNGGSWSDGGNVFIGDYRGWESQQWEIIAPPAETEKYTTLGSITPENENDLEDINRGETEWDAASEVEKLLYFTEDQDSYNAAYAGATAATLVYDVAADMPLHFLNNTGEEYDDYPVSRLLTEEGSNSTQYAFFLSELNDIMAAAETLVMPGNKISFIRKQERQFLNKNQILTGLNWQYSIGQHRVYTSSTVVRNGNLFSAEITYGIRDYYNWDPKYHDNFIDIPSSILWRLNYHGWARNYRVEGTAQITLTWEYGQRTGDSIGLTIH